MHQNHFLGHIGERPEGCHHRARQCLLKGCEHLFLPRCYELFTLPHEQSCKRFCGIACRLALRRVLDREARYQARCRQPRWERVTKRVRPPDTS